MAYKVNYHKDPLGLMSGKIPQDYLRLVQSLIRPDDEEPSPVQQRPLPIIPVNDTHQQFTSMEQHPPKKSQV